ncbi:unnamed protein product, partial [Porites evermanni]
SLTANGNYDINKKRLTNVGAPTDNNDSATKKYVDDNSSRSSTTHLKVDSNIDMKNTYRITNLSTPLDGKEPPTKDYVDNTFLDRDGSYPMKGNLNMDNNRIFNLPAPNGGNQPTPLAFTDLKYVARDGSSTMTNNLNMDNKKIINLRPPTSDNDVTNKKYKYVDDNTGAPDLSDYLEKDGTIAMTGNLNLNNNKIVNLKNLGVPTQDNEAVNKGYVDNLVHHTAVQPSHYKDEFSYLMSSGAQWTDETDGGNSFVITKIGDLAPNKGNFHDYNHKVIYASIGKQFLDGIIQKYIYKMGINFYRLTANTEYTLCLEILNTDYNLWNNTQISVDKGTSKGLSIGNVIVKKLSHRYTDSNKLTKVMYYHRIIINFRKLPSGNKFFIHILVDILRGGYNISTYPRLFSGVYIIAYGIVGTFSNINPDKVYDYHTAFDIKPTEVVYNVDINANQKAIKNIKLDRNSDNSAATVGMVKELAPYTVNNLSRKYFEEVFDFTDANNYKLNKTSSGVVFNYLKSITGDTTKDMGIPNRTIDDIRKEGLNIKNYKVSFSPTVDKSLSASDVKTLKDFYKHYHKKYWCFKKSYKSYKFLDDVFTISGISLVAIGTISGGITLNPVVLGVVNGAGVIVTGIGKKNNYKRKIEMTRIAFTTYEKVLVELRAALRGDEWNKEEFVDRMKLVDEMIIDQTPLADRFVSRYEKKFGLSKQ